MYCRLKYWISIWFRIKRNQLRIFKRARHQELLTVVPAELVSTQRDFKKM